jgi:Glutathione S-transferase, N-terminal domain
VKLYVCYGTFQTPRPGGHPCANAHTALCEAGWDPQVVRSYGFGALPDFLNRTQGRREVKELTGQNWVPALVTDDGQVIQDSKRIVEWAQSHPAPPAYKPA